PRSLSAPPPRNRRTRRHPGRNLSRRRSQRRRSRRSDSVAFLRFSRDKRGYEHFYLVEAVTNRKGKSRSRVLYWYRTPPNVKVGRAPFDDEVRRALEKQYPDVSFDWTKIVDAPIPSADAEKWRERRRTERAERAARRQADGESSADPRSEDSSEDIDAVLTLDED